MKKAIFFLSLHNDLSENEYTIIFGTHSVNVLY